MPSTRITVALNAKQSVKSPLILPGSAKHDPKAPNSYQSLIFKAAQSKLRLKKPSRVFVARSGQELLSEEDWARVLENDIVLLISAGEEYVGKREEASSAGDGDNSPKMAATVSILAQTTYVDSTSIYQLRNTAKTLPGIIHAVGQPDLHPGNKFPIGAVFVSKNWIHPPLIGGDIGCGMAWFRTKLARGHVEGDKGKRIVEKLRGLEGAWRSQVAREAWLSDKKGNSYSAGEEWDTSLGTIGTGNHFAELQVVEGINRSLPNLGPKFEIKENEVLLLIHSGSRGYGGFILTKYTPEGHVSMPYPSETASSYLKDHNRACEWAEANRDLIALRFLACLEPGEESWALGVNEDGNVNEEEVKRAREAVRVRKVVDIWHNNVEKSSWPPDGCPASSLEVLSISDKEQQQTELQKPEKENTQAFFIHRKGAAPTLNPKTHIPLPLLPLPGSRGTSTIILQPRFSETNAHGFNNALSLAHGAGRAMSRVKAASSLESKYNGKWEEMLIPPSSSSATSSKPSDAPTTTIESPSMALLSTIPRPKMHGAGGKPNSGGAWIVCSDKALIWEEAPEAYKDVVEVAKDLMESGSAEVRGWCRPVVGYKVRRE
ncbi:MAG: hypothetical protein M1834_008109 [Cirrosporium novae-zelandiae]|nr:MAG: hypothetical protein M1834_008109 [Cirrosporium novae-zelandiae]